VNKIWIAFNVFCLKLFVVCNAAVVTHRVLIYTPSLTLTELNLRQLGLSLTRCLKAVKLGIPSYLNNTLKPYAPLRALRSSNMDLL